MIFFVKIKNQEPKDPPKQQKVLCASADETKLHIVQYLDACGKFILWQTHFYTEATVSNKPN